MPWIQLCHECNSETHIEHVKGGIYKDVCNNKDCGYEEEFHATCQICEKKVDITTGICPDKECEGATTWLGRQL